MITLVITFLTLLWPTDHGYAGMELMHDPPSVPSNPAGFDVNLGTVSSASSLTWPASGPLDGWQVHTGPRSEIAPGATGGPQAEAHGFDCFDESASWERSDLQERGCRPLVCPPGGLVEAEPCGMDWNGDCGVVPPRFDVMECGQTYCGTTWAADGQRDNDWYQLTIPFIVSINLQLSTEAVPMVARLARSDCPELVVATLSAGFCRTSGIGAIHVSPGVYYLHVAPASGIFSGFPCGEQTDGSASRL